MGNVLKSTFDEAMQRRFRGLNILHKPACRDCWAKYFCCGGCIANAWKMNGDLCAPDGMSCEIFKAHLECALWVYACERSFLPSGEDGRPMQTNGGERPIG